MGLGCLAAPVLTAGAALVVLGSALRVWAVAILGLITVVGGAIVVGVAWQAQVLARRAWVRRQRELRREAELLDAQQREYQQRAWLALPENVIAAATDPHELALELTSGDGGGFFVGVTADRREWKTAPRVHGVFESAFKSCLVGKVGGHAELIQVSLSVRQLPDKDWHR
jgi:hypothetical protein